MELHAFIILKQTIEARWHLMNGKLVWREFSAIT